MLVMLVMTIIQRGMGFVRGLWFCRVLDDAVVGQWSMAYDFIIMITPVMLLGMTGSLPRYVEHYRLRGHLSAFVGRLSIGTLVLGLLFVATLMLFPATFGWLVFLDANSVSLVYGVGVGVVAIIAFNFVYELVASLRQVRVASAMQFVQSVSFTLLAIVWLACGGGVTGVLYAFSAGTVLGMVPGVLSLSAGWKGLPAPRERFKPQSMWRRVLPFAGALWLMNLLSNVFALSDRFMILHLLPAGDLDPSAAIGQYHSGRIFPVLLMSLATMVSGVLLPYLSADWEMGRKQEVRERLRKILLAISVCFTAGAAVALLAAPWIFRELLQNRYTAGLQLMPMAFVFSIWVAVSTIAQNYLWVAERGKSVALAVACGLVANVMLNLLLLPIWGLQGAVVATLLANGVLLVTLWVAMMRHGYPLDSSTFYVTVLPATLLAGPWIAIASAISSLLASPQSRRWLTEAWQELAPRFPFLARRLSHSGLSSS